MPSKIRVLDEHTINKIAAGEVIENPSSVVKELVENALDAEATDICVEIKGGGRQMIRITDNGCGMSADDAILCLERHATSKIKAVEDIHTLMTMGFRGEAVPSIAAISKFSILTRQRESAETEGTMVIVEGGKILKCCPAARSVGTTMEVKSLFFNIPVRKKFQKSPVHDVNEILKTMTLLALGYPHIKFRLISDQETLLSAPPPNDESPLEQLKERVGSVLGGTYIEGCVPVDEKLEDYHLQGWIGLPHEHRQNRTGQYLFINHRGIQSPLVSFAVKDGYGTAIPTQRHPIYVLHLTMSGSLVDVNVHPQKREVRLRQEQLLREMVVETVRKGLQKTGIESSFHFQPPAFQVNTDPVFEPPRVFFSAVNPTIHFTREEERLIGASKPYVPYTPPLPVKKEAPELPLLFTAPKKTSPKVIATLPCYLILESIPDDRPGAKDGLCLVDQRAAHARIIFEKLIQQHNGGELEVQQLLIPHSIEFSPSEALCLKQHLALLEEQGIHLQEFGRSSFLLDGLPEVMGNIDPTAFLCEVLACLNESSGHQAVAHHIQKKIAFAAVRASVSKDRRLSTIEGQSLVQQLFECEAPWHCPQGKPTTAIITPEELNKLFS